MSAVFPRGSFDRCAIAAEPVAQESRDTTNRGHADTGSVMNLPVWHTLQQQFDDLPAVSKGLQFRRCAEILEEIAAFSSGPQRFDGVEKRVFGAFSLDPGLVSVGFHD